MDHLILASTSAYRRALLTRLCLPFEAVDPAVEESEREGETPAELAHRLSAAKARAAASPHATVIGADQVAAIDDRVLRKPGSAARAVDQLLLCQGRAVDFHTAVTIVNGPAREERSFVDHTKVYFKRLDRRALERYVELEQALDCAGGFKVESLGIALFSKIESADPTALMGLPMIWVASTLSEWGIDPLLEPRASTREA